MVGDTNDTTDVFVRSNSSDGSEQRRPVFRGRGCAVGGESEDKKWVAPIHPLIVPYLLWHGSPYLVAARSG
jgi:hypothetical protein